MTRTVLWALLSHWRRAPLQLFTLIAGLALATGLWSGVQAINAEARASYDAAAATLGEGRYARIEAASGGEIALADYVALRRAGWQVSPVVQGRLGEVRLVGIEPLTAPGGIGPGAEEADIAAFLGGAGQVFGRAEALDALPALDAERVVAPDVAPGTVLTDISVAQRLLERDGVDALLVAPEQPLGRADLAEIAPDLALRLAQGGSEIGRLTDSFHLNLTAFGLLCFAVGIFIVHGAVGLAFEQRRPVLRTMRALGVPLGRLVALVVAELAGIALVAGTIGVGLGWLLAASLLPDVAATLRGLYGAEVAGGLTFRPVWWLSGLGIAVLGTALAATLMRQTRSAMLGVLKSDYVRTARAKGLAERRVILKHAFRNALTPIVTLTALLFGELIAGAVLTEQIFTIPGFGKLVVDAVFNRDYAVVQGIVLVTAMGFIVMNILADAAYFVLNPRLRKQ